MCHTRISHEMDPGFLWTHPPVLPSNSPCECALIPLEPHVRVCAARHCGLAVDHARHSQPAGIVRLAKSHVPAANTLPLCPSALRAKPAAP